MKTIFFMFLGAYFVAMVSGIWQVCKEPQDKDAPGRLNLGALVTFLGAPLLAFLGWAIGF